MAEFIFRNLVEDDHNRIELESILLNGMKIDTHEADELNNEILLKQIEQSNYQSNSQADIGGKIISHQTEKEKREHNKNTHREEITESLSFRHSTPPFLKIIPQPRLNYKVVRTLQRENKKHPDQPDAHKTMKPTCNGLQAGSFSLINLNLAASRR